MSDALDTGTNTTDTGTSDTAASTATNAAATADVGKASATAASEQTGTTGANDTATGTETTESKPADKPTGAPERYEFTAPEGQSFQPQVLAKFEGVAKELNLSQDDAQKVLSTMAPEIAAAQQAQLAKVQGEWEESAKTDKEFGGDKLDENLAVAKKAIDAFGSPELKTFLNETGLGNHPELIRAFVRAGKAISEDRFVPAGTATNPGADADLASRMYPNMSKT